MLGFLFWLFFLGIALASLQDLKRREVDNWLNYFLLISSFVFILFSEISSENYWILLMALFSFVIVFALANLFYYSRFFAGGDAKLLIAMPVLFVGASLVSTMINIGIFILFLLLAGSVWGFLYGAGLFFKNFRKSIFYLKKQFERYKIYVWFFLIFIFVFIGLSFIFKLFLFFAGFIFLAGILFVFAKTVENTAMLKKIPAKDLREGDWLVDDVRVGSKIVRKNWEGLFKDDLRILKKSNKKVLIKEGIPFVPGFLIAFLIYWFFKDWIVSFLFGMI